MAEYPSVREALYRSADAEDAKVSKASVGYEHPAAKANHCGICDHWQPPRSCEVVSGRIQSEDWCKRYLRPAGRVENSKEAK
jgi:major membrane immunogen (membrane-anchored lipoprotein)